MDRNKYVVQCRKMLGVSLSARRAWIEIRAKLRPEYFLTVALRKESVDRNVEEYLNAGSLDRRSPQGERG